MVVNRRKKIVKQRGKTTHGWGSKKKHRGAGSRGGRGRAGSKSHKKLHLLKMGMKSGKKGFKTPRKKTKAINIKQLDLMIPNLKLNKKAGKIHVNLSSLGYDKLLGFGKPGQPLLVEAKKFSKKAKEKIEKAGGEILELS